MNDRTQPSDLPLRIQAPCSKTWGELQGDEKQRYCSECRLHVHAAAQLTRDEARELVSRSESRICMRVQYDPSGTPIFRDSTIAPTARRPASRFASWALSAAVGLLAACSGRSSEQEQPNDPNTGGEASNKMGKVAPPELLGDVATPAPQPPPERLGEVSVPEPTPTPEPPLVRD
ncbi:MAG: hypothetical protein K8S98_10160 [Planctomycetes bacterium]|nr:hypothetical protein [Planctomycetota bacterium]